MVCFNESGLLRYYFGMCSNCLGGNKAALGGDIVDMGCDQA